LAANPWRVLRASRSLLPLGLCLTALFGLAPATHAQSAAPNHPVATAQSTEFFKTYCFECHGTSKPKGKISMERLVAHSSVGLHADDWEKVAEMLETAEMPPDDADVLPTDAERAAAAAWVRSSLKTYETAHSGEPGRVTVRRLTSGEYAYAVRDLTAIDLSVGIDASSDSVGGEGFTNFGDVQFVQDATIERFLEAAKLVANHAVIGAGPLQFYSDTGKTGLELSALNRIDELYAAKGFRVVSGEGGRPFGLDRYGKAFFISWYFKHRKELGDPKATLRDLAAKEGITGQFAEHIWSVVNRENLGYPSREMVDRWKALAKPTTDVQASVEQARAGCDALYKYLTTWPSWFFSRGDLAAGGLGDESPLEFDDKTLKAEPQHNYVYRLGTPAKPGPAIFQPSAPGPWTVHLAFSSVNPTPGIKPVVIWRNPRIVTRAVVPAEITPPAGAIAIAAARLKAISGPILSTQSLRSLLAAGQSAALKFGVSPDETTMEPEDFAATAPVSFEIDVPTEDKVIFFEADAELGRDRNAVVRVMVSDSAQGNPRDTKHRIVFGDPASAGYRTFRAGMAEYVSLLPPNSHGEANPADKDPVPLPFDNTYNGPEHDAFVMKVKYQRNDAFFTEKLVDGTDRAQLNEAWNDLFGSWPYHTAYLDMLADHYGLKLKSPRIEDMGLAEIAALPDEARPFVASLRKHYDEVTKALTLAQAGHVENALDFASHAWRRPLTTIEKAKLKAFYQQCRTAQSLDHDGAVRALLARILVSPAFLYRVEPVAGSSERALDDWEVASRLSFFLWSSIPDDELRRAAAAGELTNAAMLAKQVRRMAADPKARRLATEFFGQWLGFYRFDQFRGVDTGRFPEFTDQVKESMYDEAVSTFEYLVRHDRPVKEMLYADYTFLNQPLARFYGITKDVKSTDAVELVEGANAFNRGGVLRLGSVLTTTSAPLRTSPVKRGDWVLRRILGTPTPPPPADAGTLPSDPKAFGGLTLRERLAVHKRNATCAACHLRIDPMGFPLEGFDAIGRTRTAYQDGTTVDLTGELADKSTISGVDGLLGFLQNKDAQVMKTLSKKMLGYALGRTVLASDRVLVDDMIKAGGNASFADLAVKIVTSRQFRNRQGEENMHVGLNSESVSSLAGVSHPSPQLQGAPAP
jgi:Protein of unknown function (DUF1592)/Protein of unknown function (DUF1588)/Protein of unknown function (DUF1587)/Protein of unknown function (DUF1595)/Protein of unknown function (DUF1585)/Cytochrome C oxidase, cbb3-type, subunit III